MADELTLSIIKPDATSRNLVGAVVSTMEDGGLRVVAMRMTRLSRELAETLYAEHAGRHYFEGQVSYMTSGPVVAMVLAGPDAVRRHRDLMGPTDYTKALPGTVRRTWALSYRENCVHGSDGVESARREIDLLFSPDDILA